MAVACNLIVFVVLAVICLSVFLDSPEAYSVLTKTGLIALTMLAAAPLAWRLTYSLTPSHKRGLGERHYTEKSYYSEREDPQLFKEYDSEDYEARRRSRKERFERWEEREKGGFPDWIHWLVGWPVPTFLLLFLLFGEKAEDDGWTYM